MKIKIFYFLLFCFPFLISAQTDQEINQRFDSIFHHIVTQTMHQDVSKAIEMTDSLYEHSSKDEHKMRALMLSAASHQSIGNVTDAITKAILAENIAIRVKDYQWHARILGFLSSEFRNIGMLNERKDILDILEKTISKVKDSAQQNILYSMYYQERAFNLLGVFEEEQVWEFMRLSEKHLNETPDSPNKTFLKGVNELIYANAYVEFGKILILP